MDALQNSSPHKPEILAPAGDTQSFLAAVSAGADAIYLGLKHFSARMEAENFGLTDLSRLVDLAHEKGVRVYTAFNTMVKQSELQKAYNLIARLARQVHCDGLIVQDLSCLDLARQAGFSAGLFLSTLANVTHPEILSYLQKLGVARVILPRELSLDEVKIMNDACPSTMSLELFVHGALCYCVSGRCYWSSYLGGKSSLRGRCVQPCRRTYTLATHDTKKKKKAKGVKFFSCQDLSLDVLIPELLALERVRSWKIEGRKKGPHYVYHCTKAYVLLRDAPNDTAAYREAGKLLAIALGRPTTQARFLPGKPRVPTDPSGKTSSGLFVGTVQVFPEDGCVLRPKITLLPNDYLRLGSEEEKWHQTLRIARGVKAGETTRLPLPKKVQPPSNAPVFLIDRREESLVSQIAHLQSELSTRVARVSEAVSGSVVLPKPVHAKRRRDIQVLSYVPYGKENRRAQQGGLGLWLSQKTAGISKTVARRVTFWLPPVVWPNESEKIARSVRTLWRDGCRHFVANAPWQRSFFPETLPDDADLIAGPFCNVANSLALKTLATLGFSAAFVSPELSEETILQLPKVSPLPLGFVLKGAWPVGISRFGLLGLKPNVPFASPKGEEFWAREYGQNVWIYPAWSLDLTEKEQTLLAAGYVFFAELQEARPASLPEQERPGLFNWFQAVL